MFASVSVVIPARNEGAHIGACVRSVIAQEFDGELETIVSDGISGDGTAALAVAAGATVVENHEQTIPSALNRGLAAARGTILVRFDAHAEMPQGYVAACLRALGEEPGAVNVGGWRRAEGTGRWGRATGRLLAVQLGVGNPRIWRRPAVGSTRLDVETVPLGCFRIDALRAAGGWREDLHANEDFELNHRLRRAGGRVVFDPEIWSIYRPRETPLALARQYWNYGRWKAAMLAEAPDSLHSRQLAPPALLGTAVLAAAPTPLRLPARAALGLYAWLVAATAVRTRTGWHGAAALAIMHGAWGAGLLSGALRRACSGTCRSSRTGARA